MPLPSSHLARALATQELSLSLTAVGVAPRWRDDRPESLPRRDHPICARGADGGQSVKPLPGKGLNAGCGERHAAARAPSFDLAVLLK